VKMNKAHFESVQPPFLLKSTLGLSEFEDCMNSLRSECERYVGVLRGERMQDFKSFFQEIAAALQFPYYFGNNWNALDECIKDLGWLSAKIFIIGITNSELILSQEANDDCHAFGVLLKETCDVWSMPYDEDKEWGRPSRPFHIIMQCQDEKDLVKFGDIFLPEMCREIDTKFEEKRQPQ
jgi:RNAse (barnase) inhibitor barstar